MLSRKCSKKPYKYFSWNCLHQKVRFSTSQNWPWLTKFIILKTICYTRTCIFKGSHKEYTLKIIGKNSISSLSWSSEKSSKHIFFEYFPGQNLGYSIHFEFWYLYEMKTWLFYIRLKYSIFSRWFGITSKSEKHSPDFNYTEGFLAPTT